MIKSPVNSSDIEFTYPEKKNVDAILAFSYVVHADPGIFELLLHLTFRPYNSYCIYLDAKVYEGDIKTAFEGIVKCYNDRFPNSTLFLHPHQQKFTGELIVYSMQI